MTIWRRVRYAGRVQGVGFRYTAQRLASEYAVDGHIRNLPTGDVELVAGGEEKVVRAFLAALANRMAGYIEHTSESEASPLDCRGFHIRY
jgi:acylphosphatase